MFRLRIGRIRPDTPDFFWLSMFVSLMLMPRSAACSPFFEASCWAGDVGLHKGMILFLPRLDQGLFSSVRGVCCLTLSGQVNPVLYIFFRILPASPRWRALRPVAWIFYFEFFAVEQHGGAFMFLFLEINTVATGFSGSHFRMNFALGFGYILAGITSRGAVRIFWHSC